VPDPFVVVRRALRHFVKGGTPSARPVRRGALSAASFRQGQHAKCSTHPSWCAERHVVSLRAARRVLDPFVVVRRAPHHFVKGSTPSAWPVRRGAPSTASFCQGRHAECAAHLSWCAERCVIS
jgi:hypothetical protein